MKVWVIKLNTSHNQEEEELFWNESEGWVDLNSADTFSSEEVENSTAPLPMEGMWVERTRIWSVQKKNMIESMLFSMWGSIGMDIPRNYEDIVQDVYEDVCSSADEENWHDGDVAIGFRRWIENQSKG